MKKKVEMELILNTWALSWKKMKEGTLLWSECRNSYGGALQTQKPMNDVSGET